MSTFEISVESRALKSVLARAAGAAQVKSTIPIMSCCLLDASDGVLRVTTTDSYCSEQSTAEAVVKAPGSICVDARNFSDMVKQLPPAEVKLKVTGTHLELKCGKIKYRLPTVGAESFPPMPGVEGAVPVVSLASDVLLRIIAQAAYASSSDESRPHLCGVLFELADDTLTAVSTDGHRLAIASVKTPHGPATKLLVPAKGIAELKKLCSSSDTVEIRHSGKLILMTTSDTTVTITTSGEAFPPWRKVVPKTHKHSVTLDRYALLDAVKRVALVASKATSGGVRLEFGQGALSIHAESAEAGEAHEELDCACDFETRVGVNASYLAQAVSALAGDDVTIELGGELDPIVVRAVGDESAYGVVMPMRV